MRSDFEKFKELICNRDFYKAHEVLEEVWYPHRKERSAKILALKGFINASVAFELHKRGKKEKALQVWKTYIKYKPHIAESKEEIFLELERFLDAYGDKLLS